IAYAPYPAYRTIVEKGKMGELLFIWTICGAYFALASLIKAESFRPFLMTKHVLVLLTGAFLGYALVVFLLWMFAICLKKRFLIKGLAIAWGYTLIPTVAWFFFTSFSYLLIPPPRTETALGILFSFFYLVVSSVLLFWKVELCYLTLRFGLRVDLIRSVGVFMVIIPFVIIYSLVMYRVGVFRVPFL
ncbi:MAG: hypothetical protein ONA90_11530, partial [candidate division KSB1 bacterium]|nr:hypothetical protein [candidate division KSB1 bacterium]